VDDLKSIEDEVLDRLMEKLRADQSVSPDLVSRLEDLRRSGTLAQTDKVLEAYRQGVTEDGSN
jgi:hypothetical protein